MIISNSHRLYGLLQSLILKFYFLELLFTLSKLFLTRTQFLLQLFYLLQQKLPLFIHKCNHQIYFIFLTLSFSFYLNLLTTYYLFLFNFLSSLRFLFFS